MPSTENSAESCQRCNHHHRMNTENTLEYQEQIEKLQAELKERKNLIAQLDKAHAENISRFEVEAAKNQEEIGRLKYRHEALLEAFKTQQRVNHTLEDKLLMVVSDMNKRHDALESKCRLLTSQLESAHAKIAQLSSQMEDNEDEPSISDANLSRPVPLSFGAGLLTMYHSSPDLTGMAQKKPYRINTCPSKANSKQAYSPFAIQTFPPTLIFDTSSFNSTPLSKRESDETYVEEAPVRSRSNTDTRSCGPCLSSEIPSSPPPVISVIDERNSSFDLRTHRSNTGSIFTV